MRINISFFKPNRLWDDHVVIPGGFEKIWREVERLRAVLRELPPLEILELVQSLWSRYSPRPRLLCLAGVDSGYNYAEMRGYTIYMVGGAVVSSCSGVDGDLRVGLLSSDRDPEAVMAYEAVGLEVSMIERGSRDEQLVLVDGSLISKIGLLLRRARQALENPSAAEDLVARLVRSSLRGRVVFVSKNSTSRDLISAHLPMGSVSLRSDLYYFDRYTLEPGYTQPLVLGRGREPGSVSSLIARASRISGEDLLVILSYVRLSAGGALMRLEIPSRSSEDPEEAVRAVIDAISGDPRGYPVVLKEADRVSRISSADVERLRRLLGLWGEREAWEAVKRP